MCWITQLEEHHKPVKAETNVEIFKICKNLGTRNNPIIVSVYKDFEYELNKNYYQEECLPYHPYPASQYYIEIGEGFHSYSNSCIISKEGGSSEILSNNKIKIHLDMFSNKGEYIKVIGYIPKDSIYYINEFGECVSNSICLTKIEEL